MFHRIGPVVAVGMLFSMLGCDCKRHEVTPPQCGANTPKGLDFGNLNVGSVRVYPNQQLFSSSGSLNLGLTNWSVKGPAAKDYTVTSKIPASVLAGGSVAATLRFSPSAAGARQAVLEITTDCDTQNVVDIPLNGNGVDVKLCAQPNPVDFGNVQVAGTPVTQQVVITNCGGSPADLVFAALPVEGPNAGDYSVSGQSNTTLPVNGTMTLNVTFSPSVVGASTADIPVQICNQCAEQKINLTGVGVDCSLGFTPSPVTYGVVQDGQTVSQTVTVANTGTTDCTIDGFAIQNSSSPFTISSAPPVSFPVSVGSTFTLSVAYTPFAGSVNNDNLVVSYTVADPAVSSRSGNVSLQGGSQQNPCTIQVTPSSLYFGSVNANVPVTKFVTVKDVGDLACQVSGIALSASSDPGFALTNPALTSFTVNPGTSVQVNVTYSTATVAAPYRRTGTLTFQTTDTANANVTVPLSAFLNNTVYSSGWPKWHFDNRNSGQSEANTAWLQGTVGWKFNVGSPNGNTYINSPVVDTAGNVYQLGMDGSFYGVNSSGSQIWKTAISAPSGDSHPSTPAILSNGNMYVMSGNDASPPNLYFVSNAGTILFNQTFGEDGFDACPGLSNSGILFEADDDGPAVSGGSGDPASAVAFQASPSGNSVTQIGGISLPLTNESERFGIAIADDDSSYWGNNGQFFAISAPSAGFKLLSSWPSSGVTVGSAGGFSSVISDLAVDGRINPYIFAYSAWESIDPITFNTTIVGAVAALSPANGAVAWTTNLPSVSIGNVSFGAADYGNAAPAVADDGTVYVGHGDGLRALDGASGTQKWLFKSADVTSSPAIGGDGTIFFGAKDGNFYAVNPDGSLRFKVTAAAQISASPAIASDGTVYFVADDGYLYAVK